MKKYPLHITNHFNSNNQLKKRIQTIYTRKYSRMHLLLFLLTIPLLIGGIFIISFKTVYESNNNVVVATKTKSKTIKPIIYQPVTVKQTKDIGEVQTKTSSNKKIKIKPRLVATETTNLPIKNKAKINPRQVPQKTANLPLTRPGRKDTSGYLTLFSKPMEIKGVKSFIFSRGTEYSLELIDTQTQQALKTAKLLLTKRPGEVLASSNSSKLTFKCPETAVYYLSSPQLGKEFTQVQIEVKIKK